MALKLSNRPVWQKITASVCILVLCLGIFQATSLQVKAFSVGDIGDPDPGGGNGTCDTFPTGAPETLIANNITTSSVHLSWIDKVCAENSYVVEYKSGSAAYSAYSSPLPANSVGVTITGLTSNTKYYFRVQAKQGNLTSSYSNEATATTLSSTSGYQGQWVYSKARIYNVYNINDYNSVNTAAKPLFTFLAGPSSWMVRYCVNGTISAGTDTVLGDCSGNKAEINEEWSVMSWKASGGDGVYRDSGSSSNISLGAKFVVKGADTTDLTKYNTESTKQIEVGSCQGNGRAYRSGLYGISFTENSGCDGNRPGSQWSFSELPMKWSVSGTVTSK